MEITVNSLSHCSGQELTARLQDGPLGIQPVTWTLEDAFLTADSGLKMFPQRLWIHELIKSLNVNVS